MLRPNDSVRSLSGLPEIVYDSLENIGIKYMLQLVTMTSSQVKCVKGIDDKEIEMIEKSLEGEGMMLSLHPLEFVVEDMGPNDKYAYGGKEVPMDVFGLKEEYPSEDMVARYRTPSGQIDMQVQANHVMGVVELTFPLPLLKVQLKPPNAIALSDSLKQRAQDIMMFADDGQESGMLQ